MSRVISPEGLPVASGLSREACQRIAAELGDGYTVESDGMVGRRIPGVCWAWVTVAADRAEQLAAKTDATR